MRLIDADALPYSRVRIYHGEDNTGKPIVGGCNAVVMSVAIKDAPTIDAVPVVRCKDCKFRGFGACPMCHDEYTYDEDDGGDYYTVDNTMDDGFCHMGAKMAAKEAEHGQEN